jgi:EmrB/QacA subfamily drug resistance transporter
VPSASFEASIVTVDDKAPTPTKPSIGLVVFAASLPVFMATLDNLVVTNALPVLQTSLNAGIEDLEWFVNAYALSFASFILMAVALGDRFGRRRLFVSGIALFSLASAICAMSTSSEMLIAARVVQGIGGAAIMPLSLAILADSVPPRLRPISIAIWGGVGGLGVAVGPLVGGAIVEGLTWHSIFWLNIPLGIVAIPLAYRVLAESRGERVRLDIIGVILAGLGVFGIVLAVIRGNDSGWTSSVVLVSLIGGMLLTGAFLWWENLTMDPLLPLRLFHDRSFRVANTVGMVFSLGIFGTIFILVQFLQVVQGYSPLHAGILTMPWTMAPLLVSPVAGLLAARVGTRALVVVGCAFQAVGLAWLALVMSPSAPYSSFVGAFAFAGVGMGLVIPPLATAVLANMRPVDHAKASGTNSTLREIGVALGIAVLTAVFTAAGGHFTPTEYADAAVCAIWSGVAFLVLATAIGTRLPAGRGTPEMVR